MALKLNEDVKGLTVDTSDSAFLGQTVTVTVTISEFDSRRVRKAEHLEVEIGFVDESNQTSTGGETTENGTEKYS